MAQNGKIHNLVTNQNFFFLNWESLCRSLLSHTQSDINIEKWTHVIFFINFHKNEESQTYLTRLKGHIMNMKPN